MYTAKGKICEITELTTVNDIKLFELMVGYSDLYKNLISDFEVPATYTEFQLRLKTWFNNGRLFQFLINSFQQEVIGTVFFLNYNKSLKTINCSIFFIPAYHKSLIICEAIAFLLIFIKLQLSVEYVNFDVYSENINMKTIARKVGAVYISKRISSVNPSREIELYSLKIDSLKFLNRYT